MSEVSWKLFDDSYFEATPHSLVIGIFEFREADNKTEVLCLTLGTFGGCNLLISSANC